MGEVSQCGSVGGARVWSLRGMPAEQFVSRCMACGHHLSVRPSPVFNNSDGGSVFSVEGSHDFPGWTRSVAGRFAAGLNRIAEVEADGASRFRNPSQSRSGPFKAAGEIVGQDGWRASSHSQVDYTTTRRDASSRPRLLRQQDSIKPLG